MCIIIAKNKNVDNLPTEEQLKNSFIYNSDGAGFMYVKNNKVVIDKGYMTYEDFIRRYEELCKEFDNFKNKSLVVHCRIGTSSGNTPQNTHPYPISSKERDLHQLDFECDLGMVHNGIISSYTPTWKNPTTNDTQEFIMKYVNVLYSNFKDFYKHNSILNGMEDITNSKLVFLDTNDDLYYVGDFIVENDIKFSNTSYKPYTYSYNYNGRGSYYNSYSDWYYDNEYDKESYNTSEYLLPLEKDWYVVDDKSTERVGDRTLMYNFATYNLYEEQSDGTLKLISSDVIVYDENFEEVI